MPPERRGLRQCCEHGAAAGTPAPAVERRGRALPRIETGRYDPSRRTATAVVSPLELAVEAFSDTDRDCSRSRIATGLPPAGIRRSGPFGTRNRARALPGEVGDRSQSAATPLRGYSRARRGASAGVTARAAASGVAAEAATAATTGNSRHPATAVEDWDATRRPAVTARFHASRRTVARTASWHLIAGTAGLVSAPPTALRPDPLADRFALPRNRRSLR